MTWPVPTYIYHITHVDNLSSIVTESGLFSHNQMLSRRRDPVDISHQNIQDYRAHKVVPCRPGGVLHNYVPFYFAPRSPMLCSLFHNRVAGHTGGQKAIIHLVSNAQSIQDNNIDFVFTDGHGRVELSDFYNNIEHLDEVDWEIMLAKYWRDTNVDPDRKRRRQAEFLIHNFLPWELIFEIGVINSTIRDNVSEIIQSIAHKPIVNIKEEWYY